MAQSEPELAPGRERRNFVQMGAIIVIASIIGVAFALLIDWFPTQASKEGRSIDTLYDVLLICSVPMFVLVETVVLFCVWKYRMRPGQELQDGPPIHGNTRLEVLWTAFPAIMMVSLCSYAYAVLHKIEKSHHPMVVQVSGQQFAWSYTYPHGPGGKPVTTNVLYLPEGRQVDFKVRAKDVIHSFWVPAFRTKIDAVPGITTGVKATPTRLGSYPVVCAELCGLGHSLMRSTVVVVSPAKFRSWLARQKPAAPSA
jgi:cytochrome c oxidase subunit II